MTTLSPKKRRVNNKSPEIQRFKAVLDRLGIKTIDIANKSELSERTINNFIWNDEPLSGHLLRDLHLYFNVSIDWLLTGHGSMLLDVVNDQTAVYVVSGINHRAMRICNFVQEFMQSASEDERAWLETQLKLHVPQYREFLKSHHE